MIACRWQSQHQCSLLRVEATAAGIQVVVSHKLIDFLHQVYSFVCFSITLQQSGHQTEAFCLLAEQLGCVTVPDANLGVRRTAICCHKAWYAVGKDADN